MEKICQNSVINLILLKAPEELLDILKDLQSCVDKAHEKKAKKKKKKQGGNSNIPEFLLKASSVAPK